MSAKYKAINIAGVFIQLANSLPNDQIDNLKLNKLCYYAQGWHLARYGTPLFSDAIQAWDYGPLIPDVYYAYRVCGSNPIQEAVEEFNEDMLSSEEKELLADVYIHYGKYTSSALIGMTHRDGTPWSKVYEKGMNRVIDTDIIKEYFMNNPDEMISGEFDFSPEHVVYGITEEDDK